jgi:hypothetical protein
MKKLLLPLAATSLLIGVGVASANEPTKLDAAVMDNVTAGWGSSDDRNSQDRRNGGDRNNQVNNSFLSPQVNLAALNNISVLSSGNQSVGQANSNGNTFTHISR